MQRFIVGVDEAGRGPLAGPVAVGVVRAPANYDFKKNFPGLNDSKKLSPEKREYLFGVLVERVAMGEIQFCVRFSSHGVIDSVGISRAVRRAAWSGVRALAPDAEHARVLLDGLLNAPPEYEQETIVHGDSLVPIISLASIAAKVSRDRVMCRLSKKFPDYNFDIHKGYGTAKHHSAIQEFGLCVLHRRTYTRRFLTRRSVL
jgi:ribonuclease HII